MYVTRVKTYFISSIQFQVEMTFYLLLTVEFIPNLCNVENW